MKCAKGENSLFINPKPILKLEDRFLTIAKIEPSERDVTRVKLCDCDDLEPSFTCLSLKRKICMPEEEWTLLFKFSWNNVSCYAGSQHSLDLEVLIQDWERRCLAQSLQDLWTNLLLYSDMADQAASFTFISHLKPIQEYTSSMSELPFCCLSPSQTPFDLSTFFQSFRKTTSSEKPLVEHSQNLSTLITKKLNKVPIWLLGNCETYNAWNLWTSSRY